MSQVLIAYASKYGCTEECAKTLATKLSTAADLWNLKEKKQFDLAAYDKIIIGGSIYAGKIQKEVRNFCVENDGILKNKKLGLFICGSGEGDAADKEIEASFPKELLNHALAKKCFGGKIILSKLNFLERKIVKMVAKVESDMSNLSENAMSQFAEIMNEA